MHCSIAMRLSAPLLLVLALVGALRAEESPAVRLTKDLQPLSSLLAGRHKAFSLTADIDLSIGGKPQEIDARLDRFDEQSFDLDLKHAEYWVRLRRRADRTALVLPYHKVVFLGVGDVEQHDRLSPEGIVDRLVSSGSAVSVYAPLITADEPGALSLLITSLLKATHDATTGGWSIGDKMTFRFQNEGATLEVRRQEDRVSLNLDTSPPTMAPLGDWPEMKVVEIPRRELESQLARGVRRLLEIVAPGPTLVTPRKSEKKVPHGELRWIEGQRVVLLQGTPEEIGKAHGELLRDQAHRCLDSVLNTFGTVQTVRTGRWFRHDVQAANERLAPHIPPRHRREMVALAESLELDPELVQMANVFPELFHCSGFAVFGAATVDGKLYHGRVLDYMTTIGLQDAATTFIVAPEGQRAFANVGYAGFIGSVSGMNEAGISLGEMGGGGEGRWDGAPMATLMRRALEECDTLDEVQALWKNSPRTCEYFYVFADGKSNRAVGVSATPESIEFVLPGQTHPRLGEGIEDAVVLSAGSRLATLRARVADRHGRIDEQTAVWLMSRPVAMQSNLHNVLFVPADGVLLVANADHRRPAAECPYVRLDLKKLLASIATAVE
ncbi:MAG: C45 family peptidase [Pirellulaceae bacterium]